MVRVVVMEIKEALDYFESLGYKRSVIFFKIIVKDFQRHCSLIDDGIIGPLTEAKMRHFRKDNFCPEVFEPIKPGLSYSEQSLEKLCRHNLKGLGKVFHVASGLHNIDALHIMAHAILESDWGRSAIAAKKKNLFGFRAYDSSPMQSAYGFADFTDCIMTWCEFMNKYYLNVGGKYYNGNHENGVNVMYASSPIAGINKSFIVKDLRSKIASL